MTARRTNRTLPRVAAACALFGLVAVLAPSPAVAGTGSDHGGDAHVTAKTLRSAVLARELARAETAYRNANETVQALSEHSAQLAHTAELATAEADRAYAKMHDEDGGGVISTVTGFFHRGESDVDRAAEAADNAAHARQLASLAADAVGTAITRSETARTAWETALAEANELNTKQAALVAAKAAARQSRFRHGYHPAGRAEDARNHRALDHWLAYLASLGADGIVPPPADELRHPHRRQGRLDALRDATGHAVPGVAELDEDGSAPVVVLPAETIRAVSEAFSRVGLRKAAATTGHAAYSCGGLVAQTWHAAGASVPTDSLAQWRKLRPVPLSQLQVGDVLVLGAKRSGLTGSGVYLGNGLLIGADAEGGPAAVRQVAMRDVYGARRATLPSHTALRVPAAANCGLVEQPDAAVSVANTPGPLQFPVADGTYTMSAGFGDSGGLWSSGAHTGQDFAAPIGTPVYAAAGGTVTLEKTSWAGTLVRIAHGAGVETWYAHMSTIDVTDGQSVTAGQRLGGVGDRGNTTGPHLHFELRLDGIAVDPMSVLAPTSFSEGGAFVNGDLPEGSLCDATVGGVQVLRCDAAVSFRLMSADYQEALGTELCITDSYRSRAIQEQVFRTKPTLAAVPGTSNHGWGVAVDLCGGIERFGTPEHAWLTTHGPAYGWIHPAWAAENGSKPEAWHFEYAG